MGVPAPKFSGELERIISGASGVYACEEGFETFIYLFIYLLIIR
jgi:hypothetical protein